MLSCSKIAQVNFKSTPTRMLVFLKTLRYTVYIFKLYLFREGSLGAIFSFAGTQRSCNKPDLSFHSRAVNCVFLLSNLLVDAWHSQRSAVFRQPDKPGAFMLNKQHSFAAPSRSAHRGIWADLLWGCSVRHLLPCFLSSTNGCVPLYSLWDTVARAQSSSIMFTSNFLSG